MTDKSLGQVNYEAYKEALQRNVWQDAAWQAAAEAVALEARKGAGVMVPMTPELEAALEAWRTMKETVGTHRGWSCEDDLLRAYRLAKEAYEKEQG